MRLDFPELAVHRFNDRGSEIHKIRSSANLRPFVTAEVVKVEELAPSGSGLLHKELDEIVKDDDED